MKLKNINVYAYSFVVLGFCLHLLIFRSGHLTPDSEFQYTQVLSQNYNDWHPIMMAWWWHILIKIYPGPLLYFIQNLCFYWGSFLILYFTFKSRYGAYALFFIALGFLPSLFPWAGYILKDVAAATCLFFTLSLLLYYFIQQKKIPLGLNLVIAIFLFYAFAVKINMITLMPFVVAFWGFLNFKHALHTTFFTLAVIACLIFFYYVFNAALHPIKMHSWQGIALYDLMSLSYHTHHMLLPAYIVGNGQVVNLQTLSAEFPNCFNANWLLYENHLITTNPQNLSVLYSAWIKALQAHPGEYLLDRGIVFCSLLKLNYWMHNIPHQKLYQFSLSVPWIYFMTSLSVMIMAFKKFHGKFKITLLFLGAVFYSFALPHFFIAPSDDYRYLYPCMLIGNLILLLGICEFFYLKSNRVSE